MAAVQSLNLELEMQKECTTEQASSVGKHRSLDLRKNPLLISILECVETLKEMTTEKMLPEQYIQGMRGFMFMKTDKVCGRLSLLAMSVTPTDLRTHSRRLDSVCQSRRATACWLRGAHHGQAGGELTALPPAKHTIICMPS